MKRIDKIKIKLLTKIEFLLYDIEYITGRMANWCKRKRWEIEDDPD
jgi:hypothetical protein